MATAIRYFRFAPRRACKHRSTEPRNVMMLATAKEFGRLTGGSIGMQKTKNWAIEVN